MKEKNKNYYAVIMAGGVGSRFWPVSTPDNPKQFHDMLGTGKSLIQQTHDRLARLIPEQNILVATNEKYKDLVLQHLPDMKASQLLLEPAMRNTAPCVLYSALKVDDLNEEAVMIVAPSDHYIENEEEFIRNVETAFKKCQQSDVLMTLGIKPTGPNTGYGYIQFEEGTEEIKKVKDFTEKPDLEKAKMFLAQGDYVWNAGIFIWSAKSILRSFEGLQPQMFDLFSQGQGLWNSGKENAFIRENYASAENVSIDYGIMEGAQKINCVPVDFGWSDLGSWSAAYDQSNKDESGNALSGDAIVVDSENCLLRAPKDKLVALVGVKDLAVVDTGDCLLVCPLDKAQKVKEVVQALKAGDRKDLL